MCNPNWDKETIKFWNDREAFLEQVMPLRSEPKSKPKVLGWKVLRFGHYKSPYLSVSLLAQRNKVSIIPRFTYFLKVHLFSGDGELLYAARGVEIEFGKWDEECLKGLILNSYKTACKKGEITFCKRVFSGHMEVLAKALKHGHLYANKDGSLNIYWVRNTYKYGSKWHDQPPTPDTKKKALLKNRHYLLNKIKLDGEY